MPSVDVQQAIPGWVLDEAVSPTAKLQQGDLIKFDGSDDPVRSAGIIVTADCDLEQKKHARLVTLIPVVTAKTLLEQYLIPEDCEKKRSIIEDYIFDTFGIEKKQDREIKLSCLQQKIKENNETLSNIEKISAEFVLEMHDSISVAVYKDLMAAIKISPKQSDAFRDQIKSRGDILILPDTKKFGIIGGIAWIRHIWQMPLGDIAIRTSEIGAKPGEKIARLDSPFRYRLTQLMAQVFSDIGLPTIPNQIDHFVKDAYNAA